MAAEDRRSFLPEEWANEERMRVLMGPMPEGAQDEVARAARHTFWGAAVHAWCQDTLRPCFTLQECQAAFRRGTQVPQCLPQVLHHMLRQSEVLLLDQLSLGEPQAESWLGWGRRVLVARPTQLAWGTLKRAVGRDSLQGVTLVCVAVLQRMCSTVLERVWAERGRDSLLTTEGELYAQVGAAVGSADNLHLVVEALVAEGRAATLTHHGNTYVKFVLPGDTERPAITPLELAKSDLQRAKTRVEGSLTCLGEEREALRRQAKVALHSGSKTEALSMLRRKKRINKSIETQQGVLENLTSWLLHLQDAETNRQVLGALKGGVEALRTALQGENSPDAAAATLDDLQQVLEECDDLNAMVARNPMGEDDLGTLEEELEGLMLQDVEAEGEATAGEGLWLPDVPSTPPTITPQHTPLHS